MELSPGIDWQTPDAAVRVLLDAAAAARHRAYAPYSRYCVGAALRLADGILVSGCNVENASYGLSICAERAAVATAIGAGLLVPPPHGVDSAPAPGAGNSNVIHAIAIVAIGPLLPLPCGACLQVLAEFAQPDCAVWCGTLDGLTQQYTLADLLPQAFRLA
jgi:homotetrameric cytidine deaminase